MGNENVRTISSTGSWKNLCQFVRQWVSSSHPRYHQGYTWLSLWMDGQAERLVKVTYGALWLHTFPPKTIVCDDLFENNVILSTLFSKVEQHWTHLDQWHLRLTLGIESSKGLAPVPDSDLACCVDHVIMPFNLSGSLAVFHALVRPRLIIPNLIVQGAYSHNIYSFFPPSWQLRVERHSLSRLCGFQASRLQRNCSG